MTLFSVSGIEDKHVGGQIPEDTHVNQRDETTGEYNEIKDKPPPEKRDIKLQLFKQISQMTDAVFNKWTHEASQNFLVLLGLSWFRRW